MLHNHRVQNCLLYFGCSISNPLISHITISHFHTGCKANNNSYVFLFNLPIKC